MSKAKELEAATKKATELAEAAAKAAEKAKATGATDADKAAASEAAEAARVAAEAVKALEASTDPSSGSQTTKEVTGKATGITNIKNLSKALQYVGDVRILPDDIGSDFTDEQHQAALANPGYRHLIDKGLLKVS